jgi:type IV pilus assembly protein PilC
MTYPVIVLGVAGVVIAILLTKVVPQFEDMFADFGAALPAPTMIVMAMSRWLTANIGYIIIVFIATFYAFQQAIKTKRGLFIFHTVLLKLPIFGDVIIKVAVARFCRTLSTMLSSGVPILEALDICSRTAGNSVVELAIQKASRSIAEGRTIAEPLLESKVFPTMVCQMVGVGEATGALDVMLSKIADFYDEEVDTAVDALTGAMEPLIMAFLGIIVGGLVIAMYMPIFEMAGNIG